MAQRLDSTTPAFQEQFSALLASKREQAEDVHDTVMSIIARVRDDGDQALIALTKSLDRFDIDTDQLRVTPDEIDEAAASCDPDVIEALELAERRIDAYHRRQLPEDERYHDDVGTELGHRWTALDSVGLYVPGGTASYPSSVLMNAVPARVAGVERIVMTVPCPDGALNPLVLAAARLSGVTEVFRIGGAQAIAALAYGTETVQPVSKIVGPGNAYVAAAKRAVFGTVGIDMIAGPSEVLILADGHADPALIAADLLAQAEHDPSAQSILITDSADLADRVSREVDRQLQSLPRAGIAGQSWRDHGALITVGSLSEAIALVDRAAPEHLEIIAQDEDALAAKIRNAGAIFLGQLTPEAVGDYVGGPNHVLPTARSARFSSGLSVYDFIKRTSVLKCSRDALNAIGPAAATLGRAEGLEAHARSIDIRLRALNADDQR